MTTATEIPPVKFEDGKTCRHDGWGSRCYLCSPRMFPRLDYPTLEDLLRFAYENAGELEKSGAYIELRRGRGTRHAENQRSP